MDLRDVDSTLTVFSLAIDQLKRNMTLLCEKNTDIVNMNKTVSLVLNSFKAHSLHAVPRIPKTKKVEQAPRIDSGIGSQPTDEGIAKKRKGQGALKSDKKKKPAKERTTKNIIVLERIFERLPPRFVTAANLNHISELVLFMAKNPQGLYLKEISSSLNLQRVKTSQLLLSLVNSGDIQRENIKGKGLRYKLYLRKY